MKKASPRVVFHLAGDVTARRSQGAWDVLMKSYDVNLVGTVHVIRAAEEYGASVASVVRVGGLEEYGRAAVPYVETAREEPVSGYSAAQVAATHFCQALQPRMQFQIVTLRPALIYGPGQRLSFFIPSLIASCLARNDFDMTEGSQGRDLIYIDDVVEGILIAGATDKLRGAIINLASGEEHTMNAVADTIPRLTKATIQIRRGARPTQANDLEHLYGSNELAKKLLGWTPRTSLEEGLSRTIEYLRSAAASR